MTLGFDYYGLNGYEIISGLIDLVDLDGNIKFDEIYLPDMEYYQDKECASSAKKIKALMLACHLEHHEGEDCLMQFIDEKISQKNEMKLLNKINKKFKNDEDQEHARKSISTREGRFCWFKSLLRFRKRYEDLFDLSAFNGKEAITELMSKAYSAITICNKISGICREYDEILFLLLGDYAQQPISLADEIVDDVENPTKPTSDIIPF